jgi:hypothetical protein
MAAREGESRWGRDRDESIAPSRWQRFEDGIAEDVGVVTVTLIVGAVFTAHEGTIRIPKFREGSGSES